MKQCIGQFPGPANPRSVPVGHDNHRSLSHIAHGHRDLAVTTRPPNGGMPQVQCCCAVRWPFTDDQLLGILDPRWDKQTVPAAFDAIFFAIVEAQPNPYDVTASGALTVLKKPAVLAMHFDQYLLPNETPATGMDIYRWNPYEGEWVAHESELNAEQGALVTTVRALGVYAVLAPGEPGLTPGTGQGSGG